MIFQVKAIKRYLNFGFLLLSIFVLASLVSETVYARKKDYTIYWHSQVLDHQAGQ